MSWHMLQVSLAGDGRIETLVGPAHDTAEGARRDVAELLLAIHERRPGSIDRLLGAWADGVPDDTITWGPVTWSVMEALTDPLVAAQVWVEDFAALVSQAAETRIEVERPQHMDGP